MNMEQLAAHLVNDINWNLSHNGIEFEFDALDDDKLHNL